MALAYTLVLRGLVRELVLIGRNRDRARGEALDLSHAHAFLQVPLEVTAGDLEDVAGAEVVAVCASVPMTPGATDRISQAGGNVELMRTILPTIARVAPGAKLLHQ